MAEFFGELFSAAFVLTDEALADVRVGFGRSTGGGSLTFE
jgi:hypothetical protein